MKEDTKVVILPLSVGEEPNTQIAYIIRDAKTHLFLSLENKLEETDRYKAKQYRSESETIRQAITMGYKVVPPHWCDSEEGQKVAEKLFETADLPEVKEEELEEGSYTNLQIAYMFKRPDYLIKLLMHLPKDAPLDSQRYGLSKAAEEYAAVQ